VSEGLAQRLSKSPWVRRLPLLLVAVVGIVVFLPHLPHDVSVRYRLGPAARGLSAFDAVVTDSRGRAVHRTVLEGALAAHPVQHLRLAPGRYRASITLTYPDHVDHRALAFHVQREDEVELDVARP